MNINIQTNSRIVALIIAAALFLIAIPVLIAGAIFMAIAIATPAIVYALYWVAYPVMNLGIAMANRVLPDPSTLDTPEGLLPADWEV